MLRLRRNADKSEIFLFLAGNPGESPEVHRTHIKNFFGLNFKAVAEYSRTMKGVSRETTEAITEYNILSKIKLRQ